jgi:hypothetical protein
MPAVSSVQRLNITAERNRRRWKPSKKEFAATPALSSMRCRFDVSHPAKAAVDLARERIVSAMSYRRF